MVCHIHMVIVTVYPRMYNTLYAVVTSNCTMYIGASCVLCIHYSQVHAVSSTVYTNMYIAHFIGDLDK